VSRFNDDTIRAVVAKARYTDPRATDFITRTLVKRRDKVLSTWLNGVNPVVDLALDRSGVLTFGNAAIAAGVAEPPESYSLQWFELDNATDTRTNVGDAATVTTPRAPAPEALIAGTTPYIGVTITAKHPTQPGWARPATFHFRRTADGWQWVGAER
jgi:hypothetical protein